MTTQRKHPGFLAKPSRKQLIQELIEGQKTFMQEVNEHGYEEKDYWLSNEDYRKIQKNLAKQIHNDAHKQYLGEYESKSVKADISGPGSWLAEEGATYESLEDEQKDK